ncbi:MAG: site-specific integrase [Cyclobacteriaceae bacterium]|nr:site-specific integrase [Cyclobacteriaceae bacterium]
MAKTKLYVRSSYINSKGEAAIYVRYSHNDKTIDIATGEHIPPKYWDTANQQVRKSFPGHSGINNFILKKKLEIDTIRLDLKSNRVEPTVAAVKEAYIKMQTPKTDVTNSVSQNMLDQWSDFAAYQRDTKRVTEATLKQYNSTLKKLHDFESHINCLLTFEMMDNGFLDAFKKYLYNNVDSSHNTVGGKVKHLKTFLNWALDKGLTNNVKFKSFKKPSSETTIVTLTKEQLDILFFLDLKGQKRLEKARDIFVLGCSTGLRFSDYSSINLANVKRDYLVISTEKTDVQVRIPLNDYSRAILAKYPDGLPTISNTNLNKYLKEVGIQAKFFEEHEVTTYKGGHKQKFYKPLYLLLTSHCARRTFATQSLSRGMMMHDVMRITGHRDVRSFMKYVHISEPRLRKEVSKAWNTLDLLNPDEQNHL